MYSERINNLPPYLFAAIDKAKARVIEKGVDVIDLGVGDPDMPTPDNVIQALYRSAQNPNRHKYPSYTGMLSFREAAARWYKEHLGIELDPVSQVLTLIGSKEGIAHIPLAFINPGEIALVPDPAYPVYKIGTLFADGKPFIMPLLEENGFLPDLDAIPKDVAKLAKLMFLNYPNNPTSAIAPDKFFEDVIEFAKENEVIIVHDNAYSEMTFDGYKAPSFMEFDGAMDVGIEMHSLSKTYNMTGWRIGFAVGNAEILDGLGRVKTNIDSGAFEAVQEAGITAMQGPQQCISDMNKLYTQRRDALMVGLKELGIDVQPPKATFYVWAPVPEGYDSMGLSKILLEEAGIVATPGVGFGDYGEGYVRFSLTRSVERINEAVERMGQLKI
ncbi:MAG TPA: LL-diaminopimelate aminotransferase [Methanosarcinales archaeon]|nr:LL-diaminopimelate aminotransferase [Methanosarcinales archaeon]